MDAAGVKEGALRSILQARERDGEFRSLEDFCRRARVPRPVVENLILARAFEFTGLRVQELMWKLGALPDDVVADRLGRHESPSLAYDGVDDLIRSLPALNQMTEVGRVALDLHLLGVSTTANAFSFWRPRLRQMGAITSQELYNREDGDRVRVAGIVVARARPPTRSGKTAIFISLEDEMGLVDVAVFEDAYQRSGKALYTSPVLCVDGRLTRMGKLDLSVTARRVIGLGSWRDFGLSGQDDVTLGSAGGWGQTPARGGERRQAVSY